VRLKKAIDGMNCIHRTSQKPARFILSILAILSKCDMDVKCDAQPDRLTQAVRRRTESESWRMRYEERHESHPAALVGD